MSIRFFGQFLLEKDVISKADLLSAVRHQGKTNHSLCTLAIQQGFLSEAQLAEHNEWREASDKEFLEQSLRGGTLSTEQISELSKIQCDQWLTLRDALVELEYLPREQSNALFLQHKAQASADVPDLPTVPLGVSVNDILAEVLSATIDVFAHYTQAVVNVKSVSKTADELEDVAYVFSQRVFGDHRFRYALALPDELTVVVANYMFGEGSNETEASPVVLDALSEFVNIVVGHACAGLNSKNLKVSADPPVIMTRQMMKELLPSDVVTVRLEASGRLFSIGIFFENP